MIVAARVSNSVAYLSSNVVGNESHAPVIDRASSRCVNLEATQSLEIWNEIPCTSNKHMKEKMLRMSPTQVLGP